ncbi:MAG: hypothetical protein K0S97_463 [Chloroflexota bacterium]|nr:hypothetical protein [Chloroflexota bacterium]
MDVSDARPRSEARTARTSSCLAPGCPCQDARIVSHRRGRFFSHLAVVSGETADRVIPPEPDWSIPAPSDAEITNP